MELRDSADFEDMIFAKSGVGVILRRELKRLPAGTRISIGIATDPINPPNAVFGARARCSKPSPGKADSVFPSPPNLIS